MSKVRVAMVGLGWVATHRHLPAMQRNGNFQVVGAIDRSPGVARKLASANGFRHFAEKADLSDVEWLTEVDAVTIATAPMEHYRLVRQALLLGKHVLTEKPFTMRVSEAEELANAARDRDLRLAIVHNFQFARSTKQLLREIAEGRLGALRSINAVQCSNPGRRLPAWYEQLPLGLMFDESPHLLYLLRLIAGDISLTECLSYPSTLGLKTPARLDAFFESPAFSGPITMNCSFESPVSEWHLLVFGEKRLGIVDVFRDIYISLPNDGTHGTFDVLRTSLSGVSQHLWQHFVSGIPHIRGTLLYGNEEVFSRFARAIQGEPAALDPINARSGLAVLRLQHSMIERQVVIQGRDKAERTAAPIIGRG